MEWSVFRHHDPETDRSHDEREVDPAPAESRRFLDPRVVFEFADSSVEAHDASSVDLARPHQVTETEKPPSPQVTGGFHAPAETLFEARASHIRACARWHRTVSRPVAGPLRVAPDAWSRIASIRPPVIYKRERLYVPFWCAICQASYCTDHWSKRTAYDDGFYDCTYGVCPLGHEGILDD